MDPATAAIVASAVSGAIGFLGGVTVLGLQAWREHVRDKRQAQAAARDRTQQLCVSLITCVFDLMAGAEDLRQQFSLLSQVRRAGTAAAAFLAGAAGRRDLTGAGLGLAAAWQPIEHSNDAQLQWARLQVMPQMSRLAALTAELGLTDAALGAAAAALHDATGQHLFGHLGRWRPDRARTQAAFDEALERFYSQARTATGRDLTTNAPAAPTRRLPRRSAGSAR